MSRTFRRKSTSIQPLESRRLLVAFGTPWSDARDLTVSFPSEGVDVGTYENNIESTLDQVADRQEWQELALRAYQTWTIHADINVGLRNDHDVAFGTKGLLTGDPRFGEFRVGAFPQQGVLASSVPFQAIAGTNSGDLLLNSDQQITFHDWADNVGPDPATLADDDHDLFSLLLHETGNTLGLSDNVNETSVMFHQYTSPKGMLTAADIDDLKALYGERSDPYELSDNGQLQTASLVTTPVGFDTSVDVIRARGSLVSGTDVDYYKVVPGLGVDTATIQLRAAGISLLQSELQLVDASGNVIDQSTSLSVFANDNTLQINGLQNHPELYVRVAAADPDDVYSVGDYELIVDYRDDAARAGDPVRVAYDGGADAVFTNYDLADGEVGANDTFANPELLEPSAVAANRFEIHSSVSSADDVDFMTFTAPDEIEGRLIVNVSGIGLNQPDLKVRILDSSGKAVGTTGILRDDGTWAIEVAQPVPEEEYVLRVSVDSNSAVGVGDYVAVAEFIAPTEQMNDLAAGEVSDTADEFIRWTATKTRLFRFDLGTAGATSDQGVRLTIYDAHTKEVKATLVSIGDVTRSTLSWLQQGDYILRFSTVSLDSAPVTNISYSLVAEGLSDDQNGDGDDSDYDYNYDDYDYEDNYDDDSYDDDDWLDPQGYYSYDYDYDYDYDYYYP